VQVQPFRVAINAKGGDCWHIFQEKNVLVIDGKNNNDDTQKIDGKNNSEENNNNNKDTQKSTEEEIRPQSSGSEHEGLATVGSSITVKRIMAKSHPPIRDMRKS
jgi:hypothetical protein